MQPFGRFRNLKRCMYVPKQTPFTVYCGGVVHNQPFRVYLGGHSTCFLSKVRTAHSTLMALTRLFPWGTLCSINHLGFILGEGISGYLMLFGVESILLTSSFQLSFRGWNDSFHFYGSCSSLPLGDLVLN